MLLQAEKKLTHGETILDKSEHEIFQIVRNELSEKIVEEMINNGLMKIMIKEDRNDAIGPFVSVRASVRAYNPDD